MKYFIAIEEELLMKLWLLDPKLVVPYSRHRQKKNALCKNGNPENKPGQARVPALSQADQPVRKLPTHPDPKQTEGG